MTTDTDKIDLTGHSPFCRSQEFNCSGESPEVDTLAHSMSANDSSRFHQLLQLARDGDEAAAGDLWHEFATDIRSQQI